VTTTLPGLDHAARQAIAGRTEMLFREAGAFREGHFGLKSGRHADRYLEKFQVLQFPAAVSELCGYLAARVSDPESGRSLVSVVAGPTTGGIILAFEVARQLGVRGIFAEEVRDRAEPRRAFRRGFEVAPGERVLLVDDILTTGGSLLRMLEPVEEAGGEIVLASVLVDRSGGLSVLHSAGSGRDYPLEALWTLDLPTWEPGPDCPGCGRGLPLELPGAGGAGPPASAQAEGDHDAVAGGDDRR
jgi:orotate phosphoribosyltransferase